MFVALLVNSVTSPRFNTMDSVAVLAVDMGMSEVALMLLRERSAGDQEAVDAGEAPTPGSDGDRKVGPDPNAPERWKPAPPVRP